MSEIKFLSEIAKKVLSFVPNRFSKSIVDQYFGDFGAPDKVKMRTFGAGRFLYLIVLKQNLRLKYWLNCFDSQLANLFSNDFIRSIHSQKEPAEMACGYWLDT